MAALTENATSSRAAATCLDLARSLPELLALRTDLEGELLRLAAGTAEYNRADRAFVALANRIDAVEALILETPARDLADAMAQLLIVLPGLADSDCPISEQAARAVASALSAVLGVCSVELDAVLFSRYAPSFGFVA